MKKKNIPNYFSLDLFCVNISKIFCGLIFILEQKTNKYCAILYKRTKREKQINCAEMFYYYIHQYSLLHEQHISTSIGGGGGVASPWWMYPDSRQSRAKSPPTLLLLRAIWPGAAHPRDCFGTQGNKAICCS